MSNRNLMLVSLALTVFVWTGMLGTIELALGFLAMIFIHEMGHYLAAKHLGIPVSPPIFTPIGAMILMPRLPNSAKDEAFVAFAGPLLGTVGAVAGFALGLFLGVPELLYVSQMAFMLNLFNLIPLAPMDGGRISMVVSRHLWVVGAALLAYVVYSSGFSQMTLLVAMLVAWQAMQDVEMRKHLAAVDPGYFNVTPAVRIGYIVAYVALGAFLFWAYTQPMALVKVMSMLGL